jgi:hypothetical protein
MKMVFSLAAVIGVLSLATAANAQYAGGTGTAEDPFQIATAAELNEIGNHPDDWEKHFVLVNDIDLSGYKGTQFNLIGEWHQDGPLPSKPFRGVFDGQGHRIRNFTWTSSDMAYVGLFRAVQLARIQNIGLEDVSVKTVGGENIGTLVGLNDQSVVSACYSTGTISASLLVGWQAVGGLVGGNQYGTVTNCYSTVDIAGSAIRAGGLTGTSTGTVMYCYSTGRVGAGGGGFCAYGGGTVSCFWDVETSNRRESAGGSGKTTAEMMKANTYLGWEACGNEGVWTIDDGRDYPRLAWEGKPGEPLPRQRLSDHMPGDGSKANPYRISTAAQLNLIGLFPCEWDKHFILADDINLSGYKDTQFNMIGTSFPPFRGVFDGNGHAIRNFAWRSWQNRQNIGMFAVTEGQIKDLALQNVDIDAPNSGHTGAVAGSNMGTIANCSVTGRLTMWGGGGLVGINNGGRIDRCSATVDIQASDTSSGGLVGLHAGGTILESFSTGKISPGRTAGGLAGSAIGYVGYAIIENCYSLCSLSDLWESGGGLVGLAGGGAVISNCYSTGTVKGAENVAIGGLIGVCQKGSAVDGCFWNMQTSGLSASAAGLGKTTAQMKTMSTFANAGWDFVGEAANGIEDVWVRCEGTDYPILAWEGAACGSKAPRVYTLTTSSTPGGSVTKPGKGVFTFNDGETVLIEAATGAGYVFKRWSGTAVDAGKVAKPDSPSTSVVVDADYTLVANFAIDAFVEDFEKGAFGGEWSSPGDFPWYVTSDDHYTGVYSVRAGAIGDDGTTGLTLRANSKGGRIRFSRRVSSELGFDVYTFSIDGMLREELSGEHAWMEVSFPISAGSHTFVWEYRKDGGSSSGADTAYIDDVYVPTGN